MDFYLFITRRCNLSCSYCCFGDTVGVEGTQGSTHLDPRETARFILSTMEQAQSRDTDNKVFFYGGEPTLNEAFIGEFIDLTEGRLRYVLQTNGTLLDSLDPDILNRIHFLEVSIDGAREINDARRGAGTYDRIESNLRAMSSSYGGELIARMTIVPDNPLSRSVRHLLEDLNFDHLYWMHEDTVTPLVEWERSRSRYEADLDDLIEYWRSGLNAGSPRSIIPFRAIMSSLLDPPQPSPFRCGVGTYLRVIDTDGMIYPCDLMITDDKRHAIGHLTGQTIDVDLPKNTLYRDRCMGCPDLPYCGGRCFNLSLRRDPRFEEFCLRTKMLIRKLESNLVTVRGLLDKGVISVDDIRIQTTLTEQIP